MAPKHSEIDADILAQLTDDWQPSSAIWKAMGQWAEVTVSNHLSRMRKAAALESKTEPLKGVGQYRWLYRRKQPAPALP